MSSIRTISFILFDLVPRDPSTIHVKWEPTIQFWVKELKVTGLTMEDVDPNIDESLVEYELSKMDRMAKTVRLCTPIIDL